MNIAKYLPVSVVIPMRNAQTTVSACLSSLQKQSYPIREVIVIDNVSTDDSRALVRKISKGFKIPLRLICQTSDRGVASSYNLGVKAAKSSIVVFMTSDTMLPGKSELSKLVLTLMSHPHAAASYSTSVLPGFVWEKYNFWEKYFAARMVDNRSSLMVLKFDCIRKDAFLSVGGFDEVNFGGDTAIGGEDADLSNRLKEKWDIVRSNATSYHIHYMSPDYSLLQMLQSRTMYARSYGRFLRKSAAKDIRASLFFLLKPTLAILPLIPGLGIIGLFALLLFSFVYTQKMFLTSSTLLDPRIVLIPILNIFFVYYESMWMIQAFLTYKKR